MIEGWTVFHLVVSPLVYTEVTPGRQNTPDFAKHLFRTRKFVNHIGISFSDVSSSSLLWCHVVNKARKSGRDYLPKTVLSG